MEIDNTVELTCEGNSLCPYKWNCELYCADHIADLSPQKSRFAIYPWIRPGTCENYVPIKK